MKKSKESKQGRKDAKRMVKLLGMRIACRLTPLILPSGFDTEYKTAFIGTLDNKKSKVKGKKNAKRENKEDDEFEKRKKGQPVAV